MSRPVDEERAKARLDQAVERVAEVIRYGAKLHGHDLPEDFVLDRARNAVTAIADLFVDAEEAGFDRGREIGAPISALIDVELTPSWRKP